MAYTEKTWVTGEVITAEKLNHMEGGIGDNSDAIAAQVSGLAAETSAREAADTALVASLTSGDETDAVYHLGFYLDENGDLCQVDN